MNKSSVFFSNFIWRFLERSGAQAVTLVVSVILARLLNPEIYGTVALVTVFIAILQVFVDSGMGNALIQKKDADDLDFSSVFWFNISSCLCLYAAIFAAAPYVARFYDKQELASIIRVMGLALIISGVKNIQQAYVSRNMLFKKFFFATLSGTAGAAFIGIFMAYRGFGVWALVCQNLFNQILDTFILWMTVKWKPRFKISIDRLKVLFHYGWKLLVSALLDTVYNQMQQLLIGKYYTSSELAYYNQGNKFPQVIVTNVNSSIDSVLFPAMSSEQECKERVRSMTRRAIKTSTYIIMPLMIGLAACAKPLVRILLTEKWMECVFFLRVFCFTFAFYPIHTANLNAIKAMGRSDLFLKLEMIKKAAGAAMIVVTVQISVKAMVLGMLGTSILSQIINSWPNRSLLNYGYRQQLRDMMPQICLSCFMGTAISFIVLLDTADLLVLVLQIFSGAFIYICGSMLFHIDSLGYLIATVKGVHRKRDLV